MYYLPHCIGENRFVLSAGRTLFWENQKCLILSDMHLGKSGHFRKNGIGIPQHMAREDLFRLSEEIRFFNPEKLIVVGDMFHSTDNREHDMFEKYRKEHIPIEIHLVRGNHDILSKEKYHSMGIQLHPDKMNFGNIILSHDLPATGVGPYDYYITGHAHPGISLKGRGGQSLKLPCFYFGESYAILPAYGRFTGTVGIEPTRLDEVFAIADRNIIRLSTLD